MQQESPMIKLHWMRRLEEVPQTQQGQSVSDPSRDNIACLAPSTNWGLILPYLA